MDPAKCLEILSSRGTCSGDGAHGAHHGHNRAEPPTTSQASAEAAAEAVGEGSKSGDGGHAARGQVINLATGSNESVAAAQAASGLIASIASLSAGEDGASSSAVSEESNPSSSFVVGTLPSASASAVVDSPEKLPTSDASMSDGASRSNSGHSNGHGTGSSQTPGASNGRDNAPGVSNTPITRADGDAAKAQGEEPAGNSEEQNGGQGTGGDEGVAKGFEGMSPGSLIAAFRRAQEERVALYRKFNGGLKEDLKSGDFSGYPALCCEITAAFSVLSKAINAVEALLRAKAGTKPLAGIIRRVQEHERELLTLTAAHHLESMRKARALGMGPGMTAYSGNGEGNRGSSSPAQDRLLQDGVDDLLRRAQGEAAAVTELLEELRYEADELC